MKTVYFNLLLENVIGSERTNRDNIQKLVESAISTYGEHGDTSRLERLINGVKGMASIRGNTLKAFIKAHANVKFIPSKDLSTLSVKKVGKGSIEIKEVTSLWYEFDNAGKVTPDMDYIAELKKLNNKFQKRKEEGTAKVSTEIERFFALISSELEHNKAQA